MPSSSGRHACVFGLGWGDEGKGKVVDLLSPSFDVVVRFNGGANAGHTVWVGAERFALHLIPSGVLHEGVTAVIGPGVVVDPSTLLMEIDHLTARGISLHGRLKISDRAHVVMPYHKIEDQLSERAAGEGGRIGTTARGIGPCYADKMRRGGAIRFIDLLQDPGVIDRARTLVNAKRHMLLALYGDDGGLDENAVAEELQTARVRLGPMIADTTAYLHERLAGGASLMFEGANGVLLDIDHGTYPFVTSSSTGPHGIGAGAGVPVTLIGRMVGTTKAYATRVGSGPFVTELDNEIGERIRQRGNEFGTTTGRPRRCGWFDAVAGRYAVMVSGATEIALMHLDTLSGFERIGMAVSYRSSDRVWNHLPADLPRLTNVEPELEFLPGWEEDLGEIRAFDDLPGNAKRYVERIESLCGVPVTMIGVGPERSQTLIRGGGVASPPRLATPSSWAT